MYTVVIIDTVSIQSYIFGSNKLKENIGGSFIIEHLIYKEMIPLAFSECFDKDTRIEVNAWRNQQGNGFSEDPAVRMEVGYIGGGNAFLIFRNRNDANVFIQTYSKQILLHFPGLRTAYGLDSGFTYQDGKSFQDFIEGLHQNLNENRARYTALLNPFKHGIVEDCAWSNEAQETRHRAKDTDAYISQLSNSRIQAVAGSRRLLEAKYSTLLLDKYTFTDELNELGQPDDKGYIAIIHADGNGMGKKFKACSNLRELRKLSQSVSDLAERVMEKMIAYVVGLFEEQKLEDFSLFKTEDGSKKLLPIRPLIAGGDDITLVCEGRLGVHLAEKLLEFMTEEEVNGEKIAACAGVAIVHTKYPFYRAYHLSEEIMRSAKDASRDNEDSWLNFMVSTGGFSGSYQDIVAQQYTLEGNKKLKWGPYPLRGQASSFTALKQALKHLYNTWPMNKIRDLRDVLHRGESGQAYFLAEMKIRKDSGGKKDLQLPDLKDFSLNQSPLWAKEKKGTKTPYADLIELIDFYPKSLL